MYWLTQAGAIPFRRRAGRWEFLLVTSHKGNWIFPKGIVEPGESPEDTARKECREEAGVLGELLAPPLGSYCDRKWRRDCQVEMYLLRYEEDTTSWDEEAIRDRRWCTLREAQARIKKPELRSLLARAHRRLEDGAPG